MAKFGFNQSIRRTEDDRFVTGAGRYSDDIDLPRQAHAYVLRSPLAHARIKKIDTEAAQSAPGVVGLVLGAELEAAEANNVPTFVPMTNRDGSPGVQPKRPVLCTDMVRYVGDGVALVVAETYDQAKDAGQLIEVEYEALDAVADTATADQPGQPLVHDEAPNNLSFDWAYGDEAEVDAVFAKAAHVTQVDLVNNRVVANTMEPRAAIAEFDESSGKLTIYTGTQGGWFLKGLLAEGVLKVEPDKVRVVTPDVGGGFGMKAFNYPEHVMVAWAARKFSRPIKWNSERSEAFISDAMGRDHVTRAELAFDSENRVMGMRVETNANMGAYLSSFASFIPTFAALKVLPGIYDVKHLYYRVKAVFTHTTPVDAYRGAGRPEAIYVIERLIDRAARELGVDRVELRRKNLVPVSAIPFKTASGETYDSGDFASVMDAALELADWAGFDSRRQEARARGKRRGIGMGYYIESTMGDPSEHADIRFADDGKVDILVGTQSTGQGHETTFAQFAAAKLGIPLESIRIVQGDTDLIPAGGGTGGSRSLTAEAWAMDLAGDAVIERGKHYASELLEAAIGDITFDQGSFRIAGTDRAIGLLELAAEAKSMDKQPEGYEGGLDAKAEAKIENWTFPNGCHIAEVEVDEETGATELVSYKIVDDFGELLNPLIVEGQVHGGVVQGIGQALLEHTVYDADGQLLSGSFMDYAMPRAADLPPFEFSNIVVPCQNNPFGQKGCGEAGALASPPALINAIIDALADLGVERIDMPATPQAVWRAMQAA